MLYYIIGGIVAVVLVYGLFAYNKLVSRRNMVENQRSQIDVELQRRFDLIPNLVEVVKGYAQYEKEAFEATIDARNRYINSKSDTAEALETDKSLTQALSRLFALTESYPELKANKNFLDLQQELSNTEKKIAYSRQFYNDSVYRMNTLIDMFPSSIIAALFRFKKESFFSTSEAERQNVHVEV